MNGSLSDVYKVTNKHSIDIEQLKKRPLVNDFSQDIININNRIDSIIQSGMTGEEINDALAEGPLDHGISTDLRRINVNNLSKDSPAQLADMQQITQYFDQTGATDAKVLISDLQQQKYYYYDSSGRVTETIPQNIDYEVLTKISNTSYKVLKVIINNIDLGQLWEDIIVFGTQLEFEQRQIKDSTIITIDPRYWEPVMLQVDENNGIISIGGYMSGFKVTKLRLHNNNILDGHFINSYILCSMNSLLSSISNSNIVSYSPINIMNVNNLVGDFIGGTVNISDQNLTRGDIKQINGTLTIFGRDFRELDINQHEGEILLCNTYADNYCKIQQSKGQITFSQNMYKIIDIQSINSKINISGSSSTDGILNIIAHDNTIDFNSIYICDIINSDFSCSANLLQSVNIKESKVNLFNNMSIFDKVNFNIYNAQTIRLNISNLQNIPTLINVIDYTHYALDSIDIEPFTTTNPINVLVQGPWLSSIKFVDPETQTLQYTAVNGGYTTPAPPQPTSILYYYDGNSVSQTIPQSVDYEVVTKISDTSYRVLKVIINNVDKGQLWDDIIHIFELTTPWFNYRQIKDNTFKSNDPRYWEPVKLQVNNGIISQDAAGQISGFKVTKLRLHSTEQFGNFMNSYIFCPEDSLLGNISNSNIESLKLVNIINVRNLVGDFNGTVNISNQNLIRSNIKQVGTLTIFASNFGELDINQNQGTIILNNIYPTACCKIYQSNGEISFRESMYKTIDIYSIDSDIIYNRQTEMDLDNVNIQAYKNNISFTGAQKVNIYNSNYTSIGTMGTVNLYNSSVQLINYRAMTLFSLYAQNALDVRLDTSNIQPTISTIINVIDYIGTGSITTIEAFPTTNPINVLVQGPFLPSIKLVDPTTQTLQYTAVNGGYTSPQPPPAPPAYYYQYPNYPTTTIPTTGTYETLVFVADNEFYNATWDDTIYFNKNLFQKRINHTNNINVFNSDFRYWTLVNLVQDQTTGIVTITTDAPGKEISYGKDGNTTVKAGFKTTIGTLHTSDLFKKWHSIDMQIYEQECWFSDELLNITTVPIIVNVQEEEEGDVVQHLFTGRLRLLNCLNLTIQTGTEVHVGTGVGLGGKVNIQQLTGDGCRIYICDQSCSNSDINILQNGGTFEGRQNTILFKQASCVTSVVKIQQQEGMMTFGNNSCQNATININQNGIYNTLAVPQLTFNPASGRFSNVSVDQYQKDIMQQLICKLYSGNNNCQAVISQTTKGNVFVFLASKHIKMIDSSMLQYKKSTEQVRSTTAFANIELMNSEIWFWDPLLPKDDTSRCNDFLNMSIIASNSIACLDCGAYVKEPSILNFINYNNTELLVLEDNLGYGISNVLFTGESSDQSFKRITIQMGQYTAVYGVTELYYYKDGNIQQFLPAIPYEICKQISQGIYQVLYVQQNGGGQYWDDILYDNDDGNYQRRNDMYNIISDTDFRRWTHVCLRQNGFIVETTEGIKNGFRTNNGELQTMNLFKNFRNCNIITQKQQCLLGDNLQNVTLDSFAVNIMPDCKNINISSGEAADIQIGTGCGILGQINIYNTIGAVHLGANIARHGALLDITNDGISTIKIGDGSFTSSKARIIQKQAILTVGTNSCNQCTCDIQQISNIINGPDFFTKIMDNVNGYHSIKINQIQIQNKFGQTLTISNNTGEKGFIDYFNNNDIEQYSTINNVSYLTAHNSQIKQNGNFNINTINMTNSSCVTNQSQDYYNGLTLNGINSTIDLNLANLKDQQVTLNFYDVLTTSSIVTTTSSISANVLIAEATPSIALFGTKTLQYTNIYPPLPTSAAPAPIPYYYYKAGTKTKPSVQTVKPDAGVNYETLTKIQDVQYNKYQVTGVTINNVTSALWDDIIEIGVKTDVETGIVSNVFYRSTPKQNVKSTLDYRWCLIIPNADCGPYKGTDTDYASVTVFPNIIAGSYKMLQLDSTTKALHTKDEIANWRNISIDSIKDISSDVAVGNTTKGHFIIDQYIQNLTVNGPINTAVFSNCNLNMTINSTDKGNVFYDFTSANKSDSLKSNITLNLLNKHHEQCVILSGRVTTSNVTINYTGAYMPAFFILPNMYFQSSDINLTNISLHALNSTSEMFKYTTMNITSNYTSVIQADGTNSFLNSVINGQFITPSAITDDGQLINWGQNYIQTSGNSFNNSIINFKIQGCIRQNEYVQCFNDSQLDIDICQTNNNSPALNIGSNYTFTKCSGKYYTYNVYNEISLCKGKVDIYMTNDNELTDKIHNKLCSETSIRIISKINQVNNQTITFNKEFPPYALDIEHSIFLQHPTNLIRQRLPKMRIINSKLLSFSFNNAAPSYINDTTIPFVKEGRQITFQNCIIENWFEIGQADEDTAVPHNFMFNVLYVALTDYSFAPDQPEDGSTTVSTRLHVIKPKVAVTTQMGYQNVNSSEYSLIANGLLWNRIVI